MRKNSPCQFCKHTIGCHATCEKFINFQKENAEFRDMVRKRKQQESRYFFTTEEFELCRRRKVANKVFKQKRR